MTTTKVIDCFNGDTLAQNVWNDKYAMKDKDGNVLEKTPADMHMRMAKEFGRIEWKYIEIETEGNKSVIEFKELSDFGKKLYNNRLSQSLQEIEQEIFSYFDNFSRIIPQGSIMSNLGNKHVFGSLSNCFTIESPLDSYGGICKADQELVQLMKRRGGVGMTLDNLRPSNSTVTNAAKTSSGVPSFAERFSNSTREVAQEGRRGALMLLLSCKHPDIFKFVSMKSDRTKATGANVSVMLTDEFMKAIDNDNNFFCSFPTNAVLDGNHLHQCKEYNKIYSIRDISVMKIHAKELFNLISQMAHENAEPGIAFIDRIKDYCPDGVYKMYAPTECNPCQPAFAKILTKEGIKEFKDVGIGDEIWSSEGWTIIINKWSTGIKPVYSYETTSGRFVGTANHRILQNGIKIEVKNADSLDVLVGNYEKSDDFIPSIVMDGLVIGDGSKHMKSDEKVYLTIGENDECYHDSEIATLIKGRHAVKYDNAWKIETSISHEELPVIPSRIIPERYYYGDSITVRSFLRGLYSANGSVVSKRVTLKSTSINLIKQAQTMLSSVGIYSYYTTNKATEVDFENGTYLCKESYDLNISTDREKFYDSIGFIHPYKMEKLALTLSSKKRETTNSRNIVNKIYLGEYEVFDITVTNKSHTYWTGGVNVSNCAEIWMSDYETCRLIAQNYFTIIDKPFTNEATINIDKLYEQSYMQQRLGDDLVDLEVECIDRIINKILSDPQPIEIKQVELNLWQKVKTKAQEGRRTGSGFTGLGDAIAALGFKYDSDEAKVVIELISKTKMEAELDCTIDMAILRGTFTGWGRDKEFKSFGYLKGENNFYQMLFDEFPEQAIKMYNYGRRNVSWSTVAPTGTVSLMTQTTSGLEPLFKAYYIRRKKINPSESNSRVDFIDQNGDKWMEYPVLHPKFKEWIKTQEGFEIQDEYITGSEASHNVEHNTNMLEYIFKLSPWYGSEADNIDWKQRVQIQAIIQKYTSNAISSTINLHKDVNKELVGDIYKAAYKAGLKGITVYRDGSRSGVLVTETEKKVVTNEFGYNDAPKRPKELEAHYYWGKNGHEYAIIVGLLNGKPYEIFAFANPLMTCELKGKIIKHQSGEYSFESNLYTIEHLELSSDHKDEILLTRFASLMLRHGANPKFIAEQVEKSQMSVVSFPKIISRILKLYIPDQETKEKCSECGEKTMIYEEGCKKCSSCGHSKC